MFFKSQPGSSSGLRLLVAVTGALLINLLIMVLIPWLFRGDHGTKVLPRSLKKPVFVVPAKPEPQSSPAQSEPEPQPEVKLPEPPPELMPPVPMKPEINPALSHTRIKLNPSIESKLNLQSTPTQVDTPPANVMQREFYRVGELDREPVSRSRREPVYPFRARRRGIEGFVKIRFFVTRTGRVAGLEIVKAKPVGVFEKTVRQTVANWRFQPGMVGGKKVRTLVETTIVFKLGH